ncbi:MAG: hypothetical protein H6613_20295 [Ignavibacteriales bacterium]|nr:hypothetical protein [Ignavibacteriales bacterium]
MSNKIQGDIFKEVKSNLNIIDVATRLGSHLNQQKRNTLVGTCPTGHPSKSKKSFEVNTSLQLCHCYNCKMGGDVFTIVEEVKKLSKWESLKWLVKEFNLKIDTTKLQPSYKPTPEEILEKNTLINRSFLLEKNSRYWKRSVI